MHDTNSSPYPTISSNTLFHFTSSIDNIKSILKQGFKPNLSLEDLSCIESGYKVTIPMVSFCDIHLSQTILLMKFYGQYGIGLSKSWGQKYGVNPVLYTYQDSPLTSSLSRCFKWTHSGYSKMRQADLRDLPLQLWTIFTTDGRASSKKPARRNQYLELWDQLLRIQCFIKPYEGPLQRGGQSFPNVRFYDEREWRFVPELGEDLYKYILDEREYENIPTREKANTEIQTRSPISFEPVDIKYIIVSRDAEILLMIKEIEAIKGDRYTHDDIKVLHSKIITAEQIRADF